jgi:hypothetical protein
MMSMFQRDKLLDRNMSLKNDRGSPKVEWGGSRTPQRRVQIPAPRPPATPQAVNELVDPNGVEPSGSDSKGLRRRTCRAHGCCDRLPRPGSNLRRGNHLFHSASKFVPAFSGLHDSILHGKKSVGFVSGKRELINYLLFSHSLTGQGFLNPPYGALRASGRAHDNRGYGCVTNHGFIPICCLLVPSTLGFGSYGFLPVPPDQGTEIRSITHRGSPPIHRVSRVDEHMIVLCSDHGQDKTGVSRHFSCRAAEGSP